MSATDTLRAVYEAKARAELADADAITGAVPGSWEGPVVGARVAYLVAHPERTGTILDARVGDAIAAAAAALGADDAVFLVVTRPGTGAAADRARRVRRLLESADVPIAIALDAEAAEDLAAAFETEQLRPGHAVRAAGRGLAWTGEFAASLDDRAAKARAWSAMKAAAAEAGLKAKGRPKAPPRETDEVSDRPAPGGS